MSQQNNTSYGCWESVITSDLIVSETIDLSQIVIDGDYIYWLERRPKESGRSVVVCLKPDGEKRDMILPPFSARTRVHEYGGGDFAVYNQTVYFSNFSDQKLYFQSEDATAKPLTLSQNFRYADIVVDRHRNRLICIREQHCQDKKVINTIVSIPLDSSCNDGEIIISGDDFYSSPRISSDGSKLAWISWNHPDMPWDNSELWIANLDKKGFLVDKVKVTCGNESVLQPEWSPEGDLYFVSDRSGWWNIERVKNGRIEYIHKKDAEFGQPHWFFGISSYSFESSNSIICSYNQSGIWKLASIDLTSLEFSSIEIPYTDIAYVKATKGKVVFRGGSPTRFREIVEIDLVSEYTRVLKSSTNLLLEEAYISSAQTIEFLTKDGLISYGFFYKPQNPKYSSLPDENPPLIVSCHGGPTGAASTVLNLGVQYWTSRGFAFLDVNYGGSTGYGRAYRQRLNKAWGIVDVDDAVNGARHLIEKNEADPNRTVIRGASAGGYTALSALTFRDFFKAGASYFGISDLYLWKLETHKFESNYLNSLIGSNNSCEEIYKKLSPIHFADKLTSPIIFFQGLEDKIVPPNQTEMMVQVMKERKISVAYLAFEDEYHGFRKAENIKRAFDAELYFYAKIFGLTLLSDIPDFDQRRMWLNQ